MDEIVDVNIDEYHKQLKEEILNSNGYVQAEMILPTVTEEQLDKRALDDPYIHVTAKHTNPITLALLAITFDNEKERLFKMKEVKEVYDELKDFVKFNIFERDEDDEQNNFDAGD